MLNQKGTKRVNEWNVGSSEGTAMEADERSRPCGPPAVEAGEVVLRADPAAERIRFIRVVVNSLGYLQARADPVQNWD
jgi:hypothetical protein